MLLVGIEVGQLQLQPGSGKSSAFIEEIALGPELWLGLGLEVGWGLEVEVGVGVGLGGGVRV